MGSECIWSSRIVVETKPALFAIGGEAMSLPFGPGSSLGKVNGASGCAGSMEEGKHANCTKSVDILARLADKGPKESHVNSSSRGLQGGLLGLENFLDDAM